MKRFKDPIYGYVVIDNDIVSNIVDTPEFQRLRYIKQTSYLPVYAAALHNRFVHSLGVYFLGVKAYDYLYENSEKLLEKHSINKDIGDTFKLACLLHDVGHSPFSHTGEGFYIDGNNTIYNTLQQTVDDETFSKDMEFYHSQAKQAAPHEIMSAILALKRFSGNFKNAELRSFFARCITGYKFRDTEKNTTHCIYNSFISLLNSSTIDVDKLDYLIRDAFVMGYNSISIDYERLLGSLILVEFKEHSSEYPTIQLAYKKSALSVIENAIYAHDSEKKWIQNHPVILYEVFLINRIITSVRDYYNRITSTELFRLESLLPKKDGDILDNQNSQTCIEECINMLDNDDNEKYSEILHKLKEIKNSIKGSYSSVNISSLCDDDIIHIAKQIDSRFCDELLNRCARRHPVWKSESEYKVCVDGYVGDTTNLNLQNEIKILCKFQNEEAPSHCIDAESQKHCEKCLEEIITSQDLSEANKQDMENRYTLLLKWLNGLSAIAQEQGLEFSFVIYQTSKFESSFNKTDLSALPIYFPEARKTYHLKELINLFSTKSEARHEYFYLYYLRNADNKIDAFKVGKEIAKIALQDN